MKGYLDIGKLKSMDYRGLQALAKDLGISASGKAEDIMARIVAELDIPEERQLTEEEKAAAEAEEAERQRRAEQAARERAEKAAAEQEAREMAAGLVRVKATTRFLDRQLNQIKDEGEVYSVSRERAAELVAADVAEIQ